MEARMEGDKKAAHGATEGSDQPQEGAPLDEPNPVGQDSARNEYGEIGESAGEVDQPASDGDDQQSHIKGAGFILQPDSSVSEEDEQSRPS
jgi:hypothetical protein